MNAAWWIVCCRWPTRHRPVLSLPTRGCVSCPLTRALAPPASCLRIIRNLRWCTHRACSSATRLQCRRRMATRRYTTDSTVTLFRCSSFTSPLAGQYREPAAVVSYACCLLAVSFKCSCAYRCTLVVLCVLCFSAINSLVCPLKDSVVSRNNWQNYF